jgi:hypothetical protein
MENVAIHTANDRENHGGARNDDHFEVEEADL